MFGCVNVQHISDPRVRPALGLVLFGQVRGKLALSRGALAFG
jgi:hypothetical protein